MLDDNPLDGHSAAVGLTQSGCTIEPLNMPGGNREIVVRLVCGKVHLLD